MRTWRPTWTKRMRRSAISLRGNRSVVLEQLGDLDHGQQPLHWGPPSRCPPGCRKIPAVVSGRGVWPRSVRPASGHGQRRRAAVA